MKKESMLKNIIFNGFYEVLLVICPLITAPYISRVLLTEGVGVYSYTSSLVSYFIMFASLGTFTYATREISIVRDNKITVSKLFWEIEILTGITTLISLCSWIGFSFSYVEFKEYLLLYGFQIIACFFDIAWLYAGLEKFKYIVSINSIIKILSVICCFLFVKNNGDIKIYILIQVGTICLCNFSLWLFLPKFVCKCQINVKRILLHLKNTMIYFIPTISATIYTMLDKTLIGLITNENVENGYYEQATKIISIVKSAFILSVVNVICPRMSFLFKNNEKNTIRKMTYDTLNLVMLLCIGGCFGIIAVARGFVPLFFGEGYDKTIEILYFLAPLIIVLAFTKVIGSLYFIPSGNMKKGGLFITIGAIVNLILNILLIYKFKSIGAAIASLIAEIVIGILYFFNIEKILSLKDLFMIIYKKIIAGLIMLLFIKLIELIPLNEYLSLIVSILFGIAIYFVTLILLKDSSIKTGIDFIKSRRKK